MENKFSRVKTFPLRLFESVKLGMGELIPLKLFESYGCEGGNG